MPAGSPRLSNRQIAFICAAVFVLMTGAAFAAVPLYRLFCQTTGFAGTVSRVARAPDGAPLSRTLKIGFDTNVRGLPWIFKPEQTSQTLQIGATGLAFFTVTNTADHPLTGRAAYNVVPLQAGAYFHKLQCFCFSDQTIPAHATIRFPVVYFVDRKFASDPDTDTFTDVTLSYTFFPVRSSGRPEAYSAGAPSRVAARQIAPTATKPSR